MMKIEPAVRNFKRYIYRLLKAMLNPVALRVRQYLFAGVSKELSATRLALECELRSVRDALWQTTVNESEATRLACNHAIECVSQRVAGMQASLQQQILDSTLVAIQEVQAVREFTRQDLIDVQNQIKNCFQKSVDGFLSNCLDARDGVLNKISEESASLFLRVQQVKDESIQEVERMNHLVAPRLDRIELYSCAAAKRVAINCGVDEVLVRTESGYALCAATDHAVLACLIETGDLEIGTRLLIQKFLGPGDFYVDVGANIGLHILVAARAMEGKGRIVAFEPFERTKNMLEKTVWLNGFSSIVEIHQAAVSNINGRNKLFLGKTSGHHSLFSLDSALSDKQESVDVALVRLDDKISLGQEIDLMKIDAEGAELDVIESAAALISASPDIGIIVEFGASHLRRVGVSPEQWLKKFRDLGMTYRAINAYSGALEDMPVDELMAIDSSNLFFAREGSKAWLRLAQ